MRGLVLDEGVSVAGADRSIPRSLAARALARREPVFVSDAEHGTPAPGASSWFLLTAAARPSAPWPSSGWATSRCEERDALVGSARGWGCLDNARCRAASGASRKSRAQGGRGDGAAWPRWTGLKSGFVALASHELRTPLTALQASASCCDAGVRPAGGPAHRRIMRARSSARPHRQRLPRSGQLEARARAGDPRVVLDPRRYRGCRRALPPHAHHAPPRTARRGRAARVDARARRARRVLRNLIGNR